MNTIISKITKVKKGISTASIFEETGQLASINLDEQEKKYLDKKIDKEKTNVTIFRYPHLLQFVKIEKGKPLPSQMESIRKAGATLLTLLKEDNVEEIQVVGLANAGFTIAFIEGLLLAGYSFSKYKKEKDEYSLKRIFIVDSHVSKKEIESLKAVTDAVFIARDLVNEPLSALTAVKLAEEISRLGEKAGFSVEVFHHQKIKSLKMGGLLAVNKGSIDPPTFSILEWKPENARNEKPVVLVGKGIVFDTGGLSLKPTPNSMDYMKSDMGGAASVIAAIYALAKSNTPVYVVGLIPATDNRPDGNAYAPGDIITMFDKTTVEIKNTDAEGRLILADALSYAGKFGPELVIDLATLTGAAAMIAGKAAIIGMGNSPANIEKLKQSGNDVHERIIELPLWDDFAEPLKSPVADLNNLGTREGQAAIAGKFLEHFTDYPWVHLDIAGTAFLFENDGYRLKGGTGSGTRLLFRLLSNLF